MMTRASSARALFARAAFTLFAAIVFLSTIPAPTLGQSSSQPWNNPSQFVLGNNNFSITSSPATRYYEWTVSQQNIAPDGLERPMLLVNGMFPGPLVEANTGDRIVVKVTNNMTNGTSIHWHGMFQNGPLIIHSPDEPHLHEYDSDIIVMLSDFYHTPSEPLITWYLTSASEGVEPVPDNGLINGRNSFNCTNDAQAQFPTGSKNCSSNAPLSVFEFKQGLKYRIRLINSGNFADFQFSIDNHTLSVIEADGVDMQPVDVQRIPIHVAQRYSAIVQANQAVQSYWMRATMNTNCFNVVNPALNSSVTAIVHYDGAPDPGQQQPSSLDWGSKPWAGKCLDLTEAMLKPVLAKDAPEADVQIILDMSFQTITKNNVNLGYVNSTSWVPLKKAATLFQANKGVSKFAKSQMVITLNQTQTIELIVNNYDEGSHPFHLHGHQFYVLGAGDGSYLPGRSAINTTNPLRRDTVTLQTFGYTVLRFVSDNPGMWAFHCHIDWHMQAGLMMQFLSLPSVVEAFDIPKELKAMCGKA
ncbi:hypothetical protein BGZ58_000403 [Dissophora ornata]|nr:hypothetical protein BGZ58_000403 [Dissophora ornata]